MTILEEWNENGMPYRRIEINGTIATQKQVDLTHKLPETLKAKGQTEYKVWVDENADITKLSIGWQGF